MARNLTTLPKHGPLNSLQYWTKYVPWWRVCWNFVWIFLAKYSPSLTLKCFLYRLTGAKIGKNVSFGLAAMLDIFYPNLITVEDNAIIGYNTVILCHDFSVREARIGPVVIKRDALVGASCTILAGVTIGEGAEVSAMSLINADLPAGVLAGGVPVKVLRTRTEG
jgi:acetyltransferase-like isoleucine patch superfamily enzyme